jgi:hypothetical protein
VKVRLHGTPAEVAEATRRLGQVLDVVVVSDPYPDRGPSRLVRVYLEIRLDGPVSRTTGRRVADGPLATRPCHA